MKKNIFLITLITIFSLFLASCTKEVVGPAGADGKDGTNGTNGTNGVDGNANVKTTIFANATFVASGNNIFVCNLSVPSITQDIVSKGTVSVATSYDNLEWYEIGRAMSNTTTINASYSYTYKLNMVTIVFANTVNQAPPIGQSVKVTVIAGSK